MILKKTQIQAERHNRETFMKVLPTKLKNLTQLLRTPEILEMPVEPAVQCFTRVCIPTATTPTQKVAVSKAVGRRPLALSEERLSLTKRERQIEAFESQRCILHKERNHWHEDHAADRGFHSRHHCNLVHTLVPVSKSMNIFAQNLPAPSTFKVQSKQDIINEGEVANRKFHFAT